MTNAKNRRNMDGWDHYRNDGAYMRRPVQQILWRSMWIRRMWNERIREDFGRDKQYLQGCGK